MTLRSWRIQSFLPPQRVTLLVGAVLVLSVGAVTCSVPTGDGMGDNGNAIDPVFPANYRETFTEVRDCRFSSSHPGMIRVLVNDIGASAYLNDQNPLPVGSIIVKETFDGTTCENTNELSLWSAMRKEAAGFDPVDADWYWQDVLPDRTVLNDTKARCIACHQVDACLARDYMCTTP